MILILFFLKYFSETLLISVLITILLNYLLIPVMGILGAAIANSTGYLLLCILTYKSAEKVLHINYKWKKIFIMVFPLIALLIINITILNEMNLSMSIKLTIVFIYLLFLMRVNSINYKDILRIIK